MTEALGRDKGHPQATSSIRRQVRHGSVEKADAFALVPRQALFTAEQCEQLVLAVAGDTGDTDDLPGADFETFAVKTPGTHTPARSLSGGNLQKFILGREILQQPKLLIAAHPTWGVDVGAAAAIHRALIELRDAGAAILVISEDLEELFQISDRIGALSHGRLSPLQPTAATSATDVGRWMAGQFDHPTTTAA